MVNEMEITAKPKKWGNSVGVIIPKEVLEKEKITMNDELILHVEKKKDRERTALMKEGYLEMKEETRKVNKEWQAADYRE